MTDYLDKLNGIKEYYQRIIGVELNDEDGEALLGKANEDDQEVRQAVRKAKGKANPVAYAIAVLKGKNGDGKKRNGSKYDATFNFIYGHLHDEGVLSVQEIALIYDAWHGKSMAKEKASELEFRIHQHRYADCPAMWFPMFNATEREEALRICCANQSVSWVDFAHIKKEKKLSDDGEQPAKINKQKMTALISQIATVRPR